MIAINTITRLALASAILAMTILAMTTGMVTAQDIEYSGLIKRIEAIEKDRAILKTRIGTLEAERNVMRSQLASYGRSTQQPAAAPAASPVTGGCDSCCSGGGCDAWCRSAGGCGSGCDSGIGCGCGTGCDGEGGCDCGCGGGGGVGTFYFAYEVTFLQPSFANVTLGPEFDNRSGFGNRLILGRQRCDGVGFRTRLWMLNTGQEFVPPAPVTLSIDVDAFDFDLTVQKDFCSWELLASGGIRYGRLQYNLGPSFVYFEGVGPTFAAEGTRCIGNRGMYLVGNARGSVLYGHLRNRSGILGAPSEIQDEVMTVFESQLGMGWRRQLRRSELNLRFLFEAQHWTNHTLADPFVGLGSNLGLYGATFSTEFRY